MPTNKKGGYQICDILVLTYVQALALLSCGKPVLVVNDESNVPYYADSIVKDESNNVVIQKGGRTITIEDDGTITPDGLIAPESEKTYKYCVTLKFKTDDDPPHYRNLTILIELSEDYDYLENPDDFNTEFPTQQDIKALLCDGIFPYVIIYANSTDDTNSLDKTFYGINGNVTYNSGDGSFTIKAISPDSGLEQSITAYFNSNICVALQRYKQL